MFLTRGFLAVVTSTVVLGALVHPVIAQQVTLRYAGTLPIAHHLSEGQEMFAKLVAEKTDGSVKIEVYPAGQLYKAHDIPTAVVSGAVDIGFNLTNVWTGDPLSSINDIPFLYRDARHAEQAWDPEGRLFSAYTEMLTARQLKPLGVMFFGSLFDFTNNGHALEEPEDFPGMKIRSYGSLAAESLRALGASPVVMDPGEMYLALQNGIIDGAITGVTSIDQRKLWEASDFATISEAAFGVFAVNMNQGTFESLTEGQQTALMEAATETFRWSVEASIEQDKKSLEFIQEKLDVTALTPEQKAQWAEVFEPVVQSWVSRASEEDVAVLEWVRGL